MGTYQQFTSGGIPGEKQSAGGSLLPTISVTPELSVSAKGKKRTYTWQDLSTPTTHFGSTPSPSASDDGNVENGRFDVKRARSDWGGSDPLYSERSSFLAEESYLTGPRTYLSASTYGSASSFGSRRSSGLSPALDPTDAQQSLRSNMTDSDDLSDLDALDLTSNSAEHDTCFGMLRIDDISLENLRSTDEIPEITLKIQGDIVCVRHRDTNAFIALVPRHEAGTLAELSCKYRVIYNAVFATKDRLASKSKGTTKSDTLCLQVVLYGSQKDFDTVGEILAANAMYLQHPQQHDTSVAYRNPHHLCRPSRNGESSLTPTLSVPPEHEKKSTRLDDVESSRIQQVFESARGPEAFVEPSVSPCITKDLMIHQRRALAMMFEKENGGIAHTEFPSLWKFRESSGLAEYVNTVTRSAQRKVPKVCRGGILADDMGMGKTLSMLAFIVSSRDANLSGSKHQTLGSLNQGHDLSKCTLIVAPKSTIPVWEQQVRDHFKTGSIRMLIYHGSRRSAFSTSENLHDIVLTTYETLSSEWNNSNTLQSQKWLRVVLDEAHWIRDHKSRRHKAVCGLDASYRWCLTGTPIQNKLEDFGSLLYFLRCHPFHTPEDFQHHIIHSIRVNQDNGFEKLGRLVQCTSMRRTTRTGLLQISLPARINQTVYVELSDEERQVYDFFKARAADIAFGARMNGRTGSRLGNILPTITNLRLICNHSKSMLAPASLALYHTRARQLLIDELPTQLHCSSCSKSPLTELQELPCNHGLCEDCYPNSESQGLFEDVTTYPVCEHEGLTSQQDLSDMISQSENGVDAESLFSSKTTLLIIELEAQRQASSLTSQNKSVVFSRWTRMLDRIGAALRVKGFRFQRIDGSTSLAHRRNALEDFSTKPDCDVMLASIECAGIGLNLVAANQVHLMEPQWNPMVEEQALARVYRIGQTREVCMKRYIVKNSIEEYVQQIQASKLRLVNRTVTESRPTQKDLDEERLQLLKANLQ